MCQQQTAREKEAYTAASEETQSSSSCEDSSDEHDDPPIASMGVYPRGQRDEATPHDEVSQQTRPRTTKSNGSSSSRDDTNGRARHDDGAATTPNGRGRLGSRDGQRTRPGDDAGKAVNGGSFSMLSEAFARIIRPGRRRPGIAPFVTQGERDQNSSPRRNPKESKRITLPSAIKLIYVSLAFAPRLALYSCVFALGQLCRALAKLFCSSVGAPHAANKRILYISDYMPPQCHGIALRVSQYTKHLRAAGHEVHVYTCCVESRARTSFDHPTLPYVANPFNSGNQISYSVGLKLAWALGAESWDVVHVFYPNALGLFVLPACRWRGIASYCSHHVAMDEYASRYVSIPDHPNVQNLVLLTYHALYDACYRLPASYWGDVNASMTRTFLDAHLPLASKHSYVATIASGVDTDRFRRRRRLPNNVTRRTKSSINGAAVVTAGPPSEQEDEADDDDSSWRWLAHDAVDERDALRRAIGAPRDATVWVMVQRLAPEKDTHVALEALAALVRRNMRAGQSTTAFLVVAGDGPARDGLEKRADELFSRGVTTTKGSSSSEDACDATVPAAQTDGSSSDDVFVSDPFAASRVTFLGAVPNARLPTLYRAADVFVTCSRSETFGLTVTEALACGACVALPRCAVFDELYGTSLPTSWRFDAEDPRGAAFALLDAIDAATEPASKHWLAEHPIDASWEKAALDLDKQYDALVKRGRTKYTTGREFVQKRLIHLGRATMLGISFYYVLSYYYRSLYCHAISSCRIFLPALVPSSLRAACLLTFIVALEWCHC